MKYERENVVATPSYHKITKAMPNAEASRPMMLRATLMINISSRGGNQLALDIRREKPSYCVVSVKALLA